MKKALYEFFDYKDYLNAWLKSQPAEGYGLRGKFAKTIGCQTAFISQVLNGRAHLSLEQAVSLNAELGHSKDEGAFFLLLVQYTRAGTESLRSFFREQIEAVAAKRSYLKERLVSTKDLSPEDHSVYFSSWMFAAVHAYLMIPPYQTKLAISDALKIPLQKVGAILEFLVDRGLADQKGDQYSVGPIHIHLGNDSSMIAKHHTNWRLQAMQSIDTESDRDLHYSSVVCISKEDAKKLRGMCADFLENTRKVVSPSKEEELFGFCVDFFHLTRLS